ncbi:secretin N-terminal domain-containing protein [Deinococcus hopiensis]|uniref:Type IV pilus assembly protein PilQ n=1 Tax=Deinococcus hopiensis KR-140 TaxID=695939 RepID=A0A1W1VNH3_9DEIO|nr:secretin N-terminal domain-containing protein [Deinococcus hopiensis]SMB94935.1 type IV pilus assembly protein PilQ [Deinococcus hopiensis KR-140]
MKRYVLLLTAALGMAAAQTATPAPATAAPAAPVLTSPANTPRIADPKLSPATVSFDIRRAGSDLASMLVALARSAGYDIIIEPNVDPVLAANSVTAPVGTAGTATASVISYSFVNKPFNEVWPLVLDIYGLSYEAVQVGGKAVLRVSTRPVQKIVKLPDTLSSVAVERQLKLAFGTLQTTQGSTASGGNTSTGTDIVLNSPTMRIVSETTSNSIIIKGTNQEVAQVENLLSQIVSAQSTNPGEPSVQRIYKANGALADLTATLAGQFPALRVSAVPSTGQLILSGTQSQIDAALALLAQVDVSAQAQVASTTAQRVYTVKGVQADITALLGSQYPGLKVTPVGQTGQLVITGPQSQIDTALALLDQVDRPVPAAQAGPQIVQRVFQLVNASAEEVKATLEGTLARDISQSGTAQTPVNVPVTATDANGNAISVTVPRDQTNAAQVAAQAQAQQAADTAATIARNSNGATIIADKRTNALIVRGTSSQVTQIAELIPQLDQAVPQINVQIRIQEISEDAGRTLGLDWKVGFGGFNVSVGSGGLGASFDPTRSLVGFNIFPTLTALENQGLTKRVYDGSITMQSGQRSLTGSSNGPQNASTGAAATVKSGGRLEINIPSSSGNIIRQIDYGLNLDFFDPQVAPDGTITLRVRGQVSDLPAGLSANALPNLLNFTNSEAQSSITFKSGQTVLMSGLMGTTETRTNTGVPILSSIPVIGAAFGKQVTSRRQTQLLVILTGDVLK